MDKSKIFSKSAMKLDSILLEKESTKFGEKTILEIGHCPVLLVRLLGYFPVSNIRNSLQFKWISTPVLYTVVLTVIFSIMSWVFFTNLPRMLSMLGKFSTIELFVFYSLFSTIAAISMAYKFVGLINIREYMYFWKYNCKIIGQLATSINITHLDELTNILNNVRKSLRNKTIFIVIVPTIYLVISYTHFRISGRAIDYGITDVLFSASWTYEGYLHTVISVFSILFVDLYTAFLKINVLQLKATRPSILKISKLNASISKVYQINVLPAEISEDESKDGHYEQKLQASHTNYYTIESLVAKCNKFFSVTLIMEVIQATVLVLVSCCFLYVGIVRNISHIILSSAAAIVVYLNELYILGTSCTFLTKESSRFANELQFVSLEKISEELQTEVHMLAHKIASRPLSISPYNFFTLNRQLLTSIMASITTYLVVFVQFRDKEEASTIMNSTVANSLLD